MFFYIMDNQQVTMNFFKKEFNNLHGNLRDYTPKFVKSQFHYYLAGLIEGDGSIYVPNETRSKKNKKLYPSIQISFHSKDFPLAMLIQQRLRCGSIAKKKNTNAYVLTINDISGVLKIIRFCNGKFRTPKIYIFQKLMDHVGLQHEKLPLDSTEMYENAWLAGFIEADACFYLRITQQKPKISFGFYLEQRMLDIQSNQDLGCVMEKISNFLYCKLKILTRTKSEKKLHTYRIVTASEKSNKILCEYLEKYPIFSSKYLDFNDWKKGLICIQTKNRNVKQNIDSLQIIKNEMNIKRTKFIWDHLQNFYTTD